MSRARRSARRAASLLPDVRCKRPRRCHRSAFRGCEFAALCSSASATSSCCCSSASWALSVATSGCSASIERAAANADWAPALSLPANASCASTRCGASSPGAASAARRTSRSPSSGASADSASPANPSHARNSFGATSTTDSYKARARSVSPVPNGQSCHDESRRHEQRIELRRSLQEAQRFLVCPGNMVEQRSSEGDVRIRGLVGSEPRGGCARRIESTAADDFRQQTCRNLHRGPCTFTEAGVEQCHRLRNAVHLEVGPRQIELDADIARRAGWQLAPRLAPQARADRSRGTRRRGPRVWPDRPRRPSQDRAPRALPTIALAGGAFPPAPESWSHRPGAVREPPAGGFPPAPNYSLLVG